MDFERPWTLDALYAEHDTCGMGRIMRSHNASVAAAESALAAANQRADEAERKFKAQERELAILREYAEANEECAGPLVVRKGQKLDDFNSALNAAIARRSAARDAYRRFKEAGDA